MKKWSLVIDVAKCINCSNCVLAAKDEHIGNDFPGYAAAQPAHGHEWISITQHTRGSGSMIDVTYVPRMCNHCDDAPCIRKAADGAIHKRADGIVIIDPVKAKGRRDLAESCPYGSISWNEQAEVPQIWIFDAHLLDQGWKEPRCVQACPTGAMQAVNDTDAQMEERIRREELVDLRPELATKPRVKYRNLSRITHCFVGGNVCVKRADGGLDNVPEATVRLEFDGGEARLATTDCFGDFKIDALPPAGASFRLRVSHAVFGALQTQGVLLSSVNLGCLELTPQ